MTRDISTYKRGCKLKFNHFLFLSVTFRYLMLCFKSCKFKDKLIMLMSHWKVKVCHINERKGLSNATSRGRVEIYISLICWSIKVFTRIYTRVYWAIWHAANTVPSASWVNCIFWKWAQLSGPTVNVLSHWTLFNLVLWHESCHDIRNYIVKNVIYHYVFAIEIGDSCAAECSSSCSLSEEWLYPDKTDAIIKFVVTNFNCDDCYSWVIAPYVGSILQ